MTRAKLIKLVWALATMVIVARLFVVQVIEHEKWTKEGEKQHTLRDTIVAERGEILMMDEGKPVPVVMNMHVWKVIIDPKLAKREKVEVVLEREAKEYLIVKWDEVWKNPERRYYEVAKNLPIEKAQRIRNEKLAGVWMQQNVKRVYPEGEMGSGLLGFVNTEGKGQYGVEGALDKQLAGKNGLLKTVKDINNTPLTIGGENVRVPAVDGKDIVLTVDRNAQRRVEKALENGIKRSKAEEASAVVMDPRDGRVLAMANLPNYNPEDYGRVKSARNYINQVVAEPYEPASVCKAFAFAAGIEEGVMNPNSKYRNNGVIKVDGWPIQNVYKGLIGEITMQQALNYSLNTGSVQALMWLGGNDAEINQKGRERLYDYYVDKFGLGKATGVELFESVGRVALPNQGLGLNSTYANMTFGQNLNITMMQVAAGFAGLVNGGEFHQPTIVAGEMKKGELEKKPAQQNASRRVVSSETSEIMRKMLYTTRLSRRLNGTDGEGSFVGGKTGTAQVIRDGKYVMDETVASYVGFGGVQTKGGRGRTAEYDDGVDGTAEYVVMVKIAGKGRNLGGEADALPIFDEISRYMQEYIKMKW